MRIAVLATFIACSARPPSGSPPEVTTVAPDGLTIAQEPGLRDWVALTEFRLAKLTWTSPDRETITGRRLPARNLWPGDTWTLTAQFADDEQQSVSATVPPPPGGNVLIVLMDDVGVDKVGAYGAPDAPPTPTLDQLADLGQRFDRAYAAPVCSPTRGLLLTGRHARRTGVGWIADTGTRDYALPYDAVTIPEALWDTRGDSTYADAATGKWHLAGPNHPDVLVHANLSGFQWFSGLVGNPRYTEGWGYDRWSQNTNGVVETREGYLTSATIDDA
ncbi:MAG: sulfatase-like hydrolase/transferase, partial [Myxococcota bacterium]